MSSWNDVVTAAPELAAAVRSRYESTKHHVMATVRADGTPRLCGTEVDFSTGEILLGSMQGTRRAADLRRNPVVALHSAPDIELVDGDARITGRAVDANDDPTARAWLASLGPEIPPGADLWRIEPAEVVLLRIEGDTLHYDTWSATRGHRRISRKG